MADTRSPVNIRSSTELAFPDDVDDVFRDDDDDDAESSPSVEVPPEDPLKADTLLGELTDPTGS